MIGDGRVYIDEGRAKTFYSPLCGIVIEVCCLKLAVVNAIMT